MNGQRKGFSRRQGLRLGQIGFLLFALAASEAAAPAIPWKLLQPGVEYAALEVSSPTDLGDKKIHVVRVNPASARLCARLASETDKHKRTARQWSREFNLAVAANLGMYQADDLSHVGYLRSGNHINNPKWTKTYYAALAFDPKSADLAPAVLADLDLPEAKAGLEGYHRVAQNLRLIKAPGKNVWSQTEKRWSEAALAMDDQGRILILFCRTPFSMFEFNRLLLSLPLGIVRAMHLEGGPEASLSIHAGGVDLDLCGSYETGFWLNDTNTRQWPIPNVLGVAK